MFQSAELILILTPLLTAIGTWIIKNLVPSISGNYTLVIVAALSVAGSFLAEYLLTDISWIAHLIAGSAAIVVNQVYRGITKPEEDEF